MKYYIYPRLMKLKLAPEKRAFLDHVDKKWYVESFPDCDGHTQCGYVTGIVRDRFKVPVCLNIKCGDGKKDCISVESVAFYEPYSSFVTDFSEYDETNLIYDENDECDISEEEEACH